MEILGPPSSTLISKIGFEKASNSFQRPKTSNILFDVLLIVLVLGSKPIEFSFSVLILSIKAIVAPVLERAKAVMPPTKPLPTIAMSILSAKMP